jgi:hypothetical protein
MFCNFSRNKLFFFSQFHLSSTLAITKRVVLIRDAEIKSVFDQSYYVEVAQGAIFVEQNIRFGLILGQLAILKNKFGPIMSNF